MSLTGGGRFDSKEFDVKSIRNSVAISAVVAVLALVGAQQASAVSGTSGSTYKCYTETWNTAWAQKCDPSGPSKAGTFVSQVACSVQADKSMDVRRALKANGTVYGKDCTFSASNPRISWRQ